VNQTSIRNHLWWLVRHELAGMPLPLLSTKRYSNSKAAVDAFDDDIKYLHEIGIRSIIAALELPLQREIFQNCGFHYLSLQIPDGFPPTLEQVDRMLAFYDSSPKPLVVHCEGGIGRTGTLLAVILMHRGLSARAARRAVKAVMPPALENEPQVKFLPECEKHLASRPRPSTEIRSPNQPLRHGDTEV
jgi:atypical dual specificity phosphatase